MSYFLRTSTEHKTASLADEGDYAYFQSSAAYNSVDLYITNSRNNFQNTTFVFNGLSDKIPKSKSKNNNI